MGKETSGVSERTAVQDVREVAIDRGTVGSGRAIKCPFHRESTPSCVVGLRRGLYDDDGCAWYCFGCKRGGRALLIGDRGKTGTEKRKELWRLEHRFDEDPDFCAAIWSNDH